MLSGYLVGGLRERKKYVPCLLHTIGLEIAQAASWIYAVMETWRCKLRGYHMPVAGDGCQLAGGTSVQAYASSIQSA